MITAEKLYRDMVEMPVEEREKLFAVIARRGFEKDTYTRQEVFDDIRRAPFTTKEAAEYLEISEITLRRWIKAGKIPFQRMGRNLLFDVNELKSFKSAR
ncbi:MAG: excisionase family DNA-binding protein [Deltaproteobacteria bacterium]|nr:excisionase family DNA-binding protein [Deltaproteobacteria bacterium]